MRTAGRELQSRLPFFHSTLVRGKSVMAHVILLRKPNYIDIAGQKFGKLLATSYAGMDKFRAALWNCRCDCGNESVVVKGKNLRDGHTTSCGCKAPKKGTPGVFEDLTGQTFGRLTVLGRDNSKRGRVKWYCRCRCLTEIDGIDTASLKSGHTQSCGCLQREKASIAGTNSAKHRLCRSSEYSTWNMMIERCHNPRSASYGQYGAIGRRVCARWREDFRHFYADVGPKPTPAHSIDRIDNDRGYTCGKCSDCLEHGDGSNCRWATSEQQHCNRSDNTMIEYNGLRLALAEWSRRTGLSGCVISARLARGWSPEKTFRTPVKKRFATRERVVYRATVRIRNIIRDLAAHYGDDQATEIIAEAFSNATAKDTQ